MTRSNAESIHEFALAIALVAAGCIGVLAASNPAEACLHEGSDTSVDVVQTGQTALIYWDGGWQHLFLTAGAEAEGDLSNLGWVVPVPATPADYGTGHEKLFEQLGDWMNLRRVEFESSDRGPGTLGGGSSASERHLAVKPTARAGPYEITPLEPDGKKGLKALKSWLKEHDFRVPESTEPARYYVERDWSFLAVDISPKNGAERLELDGNLPPLRVSFESERAVYPLIFETNQGRFQVTVHLVTDGPVARSAFGGVASKGFHVAGSYPGGTPDFDSGGGAFEEGFGGGGSGPDPPPNSVQAAGGDPDAHYVVEHRELRENSVPEAVAASLDGVGAWEGRESVSIRTLHTPRLNSGRAEPDEWEEDWMVPAATSEQTLADVLPPEAADGDGREMFEAADTGSPTRDADVATDADERLDVRADVDSGGEHSEVRAGAPGDRAPEQRSGGANYMVAILLLFGTAIVAAGIWYVADGR